MEFYIPKCERYFVKFCRTQKHNVYRNTCTLIIYKTQCTYMIIYMTSIVLVTRTSLEWLVERVLSVVRGAEIQNNCPFCNLLMAK